MFCFLLLDISVVSFSLCFCHFGVEVSLVFFSVFLLCFISLLCRIKFCGCPELCKNTAHRKNLFSAGYLPLPVQCFLSHFMFLFSQIIPFYVVSLLPNRSGL